MNPCHDMVLPHDALWFVDAEILPAALSLLPARMLSRPARALLLAIGLQESGFKCRRQLKAGPARGFWQFEQAGGVAAVLQHPQTKPCIEPICELLRFEPTSLACHAAIENNDVLAACFARLLLWPDRRALPGVADARKAWDIYVAQWRPGKPHPETWPAHYALAWEVVGGGQGS